MKQLTALAILCLMVFASCKKENPLTADNHTVAANFTDNEAIVPGADKAQDRKSNLKIIIRTVNNASRNTYQLVLKVDSVSVGTNAEGDEKLVAMAPDAIITAGLLIPDATNPDLDQHIFLKNSLQFTKVVENGYYVFVSDPFVTNSSFDYELVGVDYSIKLPNNGQPIVVSDKNEYFILPGGKTVEQAPEFALIKDPKWASGDLVMNVTIEDDPAEQVEKVVLFFDPIIDPKDPKKLIEFAPLVFEKTHFNRNTGLSRYVLRGRWDGEYADGAQPKTANVGGFSAGGTMTMNAPKIDLNP